MQDLKKAKREAAAARFHADCFRIHGSACFFCGKRATDAMHILARSRIGAKLWYANPETNSRPGCRACHDAQGAGDLQFPKPLLRAAIRSHNKLARVPIPEV
jgi:hypothetical protein